MFTLLRRSTPTLIRTNRFFSILNTHELSILCQMPRIKAAMQKEKITENQIASAQLKNATLKTRFEHDKNFSYLRRFEETDWLHEIYRNGHLSFADYAFATIDKQNSILLFLRQCENANEVLEKKFIDLNRHLDHMQWPIFDLFNRKFCQYMLDTRIISLDMYIHGNQLDAFYAMSRFFSKVDFEPFFKNGSLSTDRLVSLNSQDISDLTRLLNEKRNLQQWITQKYLTINQFLQCSRNDRNGYLAFMYCSEIPCKNFTLEYFLSLKESTRKNLIFDQSHITPEAFDQLDVNLQESLRESLFSNIGRYALYHGYITIEQYCGLSKKARDSLCSLFRETDEIYWGAAHARRYVDRIFSGGFDFERFNTLAEQSMEEAYDYLWKDDHKTQPVFRIK